MMQDAPIQPYFASSVNFTFEEEREGNVIRQLRNCITQKALPVLAGAAVGGLASHLRRIRDLDPVNMIAQLPDGTERVNTFFDLCCKVTSAAYHACMLTWTPQSGSCGEHVRMTFVGLILHPCHM